MNSHIIPLPKILSNSKNEPKWEQYFEDAAIIGFGEFSHFTSEVFTAKAEIIKYLIVKNKLKIIAWESGFGEAEIFNKCLQSEGCDVKASFRKMISRPWNNEEVLDLMQWIQNYNQTAKEPVQFVGFDMQKYKVVYERLMNFALYKKNKSLIKILQKYGKAQEQNFKVNPNYNINNVKTAKTLKKHAVKMKDAFDGNYDSAWIKQYATLLYQSAWTWASDYAIASDLRDSFMAQNIIYLQTQNPVN